MSLLGLRVRDLGFPAGDVDWRCRPRQLVLSQQPEPPPNCDPETGGHLGAQPAALILFAVDVIVRAPPREAAVGPAQRSTE